MVGGRQVLITHEHNDVTIENFAGAPQEEVMLTKDLGLSDMMEKTCEKPEMDLMCMTGGEPLVHHAYAYYALKDCPTIDYLALTHVYPEEIERLAPVVGNSWIVLKSGVDYSYYSPVLAPFCFLRIGFLCTRVPWVIVVRQ
jgi:hypothetical protein